MDLIERFYRTLRWTDLDAVISHSACASSNLTTGFEAAVLEGSTRRILQQLLSAKGMQCHSKRDS
jgi:hypothetical protein